MCAALLSSARADDWPQWRGINRDGISAETGWLVEWPPREMWRRADLGTGYSSMAVKDGRLYTEGRVGGQGRVQCLDARVGTQVWHSVYASSTVEYNGPRATPTVHDGRVYTYSEKGIANCWDAGTGTNVWSRTVNDGLPNSWGLCSSPLIEDDMVILNAGHAGVALNRLTGADVWRNTGGGTAGRASAVAFTWNSQRVVAIYASQDLRGLVASTGTEVFRYDAINSEYNVADPILYQGTNLFISSGRQNYAALIPLGPGTLSHKWFNGNMKNKYSTCVLLGDHVYGMHAGGELRCMRVSDAHVEWTRSGFGDGGENIGSCIASDGKIIAQSYWGELSIVDATPTAYSTGGRPSYDVGGGTQWRTIPVLANGKLYCRSHNGTLVCLQLGAWPLPPWVSNEGGATKLNYNAATLNGSLISTGSAPTEVYMCWGESAGGGTTGSWEHADEVVGALKGLISLPIAGLDWQEQYYYTTHAVNSNGSAWAGVTNSFTLPSPLPDVSNGAGVSHLMHDSAVLHGDLVSTGSAPSTVYVCWGDEPGSTSTGTWDYADSLGERFPGGFSNVVSDLRPGTSYYYRCYVTNSFGVDWASPTLQFDARIPWPSISHVGSEVILRSDTVQVNGDLVSTGMAPTTVYVCWGFEEGTGGTGTWDHAVPLGELQPGAFSNLLTDLITGTGYHYRCYSTNFYGESWAGSAVSFATPERLTLAAGGGPTNGMAPLSVSFTASPSGGPAGGYLYDWDFGDAWGSTEQNPTHPYATAGVYSATLVVSAVAESATDSITVAVSLPDHDGDGIADTWEDDKFGGTNNCTGDGDRDKDTFDDGSEYVAGTNPDDSNSFASVSILLQTSGHVVVTVPTIKAEGIGYETLTRYYTLQVSTSLAHDAWEDVPACTDIEGDNEPILYTNEPGNPAELYRASIKLE